MKNFLRHTAAAAVTAAILLIYYLSRQLYPFGEATVSWCDMNQQVVPLLCAFQDAVKDGSVFYSHSMAGGMNMWGVWLFFIASPFTALTLFVEKADMAQWMNILLLGKMMLCAVSASVWFGKKHPRLPAVFAVLLSVSYAFCGYTMLFYQNIVWLDVMAIFPWLLLSLDRLMRRGDILPYVLCLTAAVSCQFYLGYMIAAFLALAAFFHLMSGCPPHLRGERALKLAAGTGGAALLSAVFWLPSLLQVMESARGENLIDSLTQGKFFAHMPTMLLLVILTAVQLPAVLDGILRGMRRDSEPEERVYLLLFGLLAAAAAIEPINKMWHTGSYQAFPGRYAFMLVFLGLILTAFSLERHRDGLVFARRSAVPAVLVMGLSAVLPILAVWLWKTKGDILTDYTGSLWGSERSLKSFLLFFFAAAALFGLALLLYRSGRIGRRAMAAVLSAIVLTEAFFYSNCFIVARSDYNLRSVTAWEDVLPEDGFYRVKNRGRDYEVNLTGAAGLNSFNHYTSLTRKNTMENLRKMGYCGYWMEICSAGGTVLTDPLLCHRFTISKVGEQEGDAVMTNGPLAVEENRRVLPMGLICGEQIFSFDDRLRSRLYYGEQMLAAVTGSEESAVREYQPLTEKNLTLSHSGEYTDLIRHDTSQISYLEYTIPAQEGRKSYYFDCFDSAENHLSEPYNESLSVYVDGQLITGQYPVSKDNGILYLGEWENREVQVFVFVRKDLAVRSFGLYSVDEQTADRMLDSAVPADRTEVDGRRITAEATAQEGEYLFLSLPFDGGWSAKVNGERVDPQQVLGGFTAVALREGENLVEMTFTPTGFWAGLILTLSGVPITLTAWWQLSVKKRRIGLGEKAAFGLFVFVFAAVFSLFYLMPPLVWLIG